VKGVAKVDIMGDQDIGSSEGLNDVGKDGEVEDLRLYRKNWDDSSTPNCK